ncbi:MAG: 30S ribosomal protein S1 [Leuconostoc mesenteroides]|uniref:Putative ribosomal protein S1 n=1 Tax=Leuconostoc mesenteroides subsp. cremoris ATCC 19254 TaxID=586220 RepID=C2KJ42_LEUMC|nr:30S ribosomal protein S1 [Leuconostoc mesenteroides]EEJ42714.1 putative ribosomal protein S1 [Leuconostoc mesenteroides subsp. cremoris ATCC 19254]MDG9749671.1 30S ribosomal protein S1 [Leuconostoc mesenteroides]ORI39674.1 30S ribosomal protein S1 [Leuconostoc mesenteroides subsp. cremoris]ORI39941.1 30S ribosomal protein S1 [Leuconostoc mesenteroides subsp. cremoris]ORI42543.1 30S ribosomal protein S1 [Leuconostoc mesenteroides subsp. cremoris]
MSETNNELLAALESADQIKVGDVVTGEVLAVDNDNQAVIGLHTGEEGVVPAREYSDDRNINLADELKVGDSVKAVVISNVTSDKEGVSYLLSKKRLEARKAWENLSFGEGDTVDAKVINAVRGGLVVDVNGVRGFVPASMVADRFVSDLNQFKNKDIKAQVIEIDAAKARLILSRKAVAAQERAAQLAEAFEKLSVGEVVEGKVARLTDFGAFVDLGGVDGLVHISEISHDRVKNPADVLTKGETVNVKILALDAEKGRISLSIKATQPGPWDKVAEEAPAGTVLEGTVKRVKDFGAFVEIFPGIEGLVHVSQISHKRIENPSEVLKSGDKVQVQVLDVKPAEERISLSMKALEEKPEREDRGNSKDSLASRADIAAYKQQDDSAATLGDLFDGKF